MNGSSDIPLQHSSTPDTRPCSLISIIPTLGMSSCRGRAEAFARRLSSKLRTLGSQADDEAISQEDEPIINCGVANTWISPHESEQTVTDLQPLRHESDSFFDFDCELESPGSPVDECEYLRLIETASNTPHNSAPESGYVCASAASSHSSTDGQFYDAANSADYHGSMVVEPHATVNVNAPTTNGSNSNSNSNSNSKSESSIINGNDKLNGKVIGKLNGNINSHNHTHDNSNGIEASDQNGPDIGKERLSNGHDTAKQPSEHVDGVAEVEVEENEDGEEDDDEDEEEVDLQYEEIGGSATDLSTKTTDDDEQSDYTTAPPISGPDMPSSTAEEDSTSTIQDQIIQELQKQSDDITELHDQQQEQQQQEQQQHNGHLEAPTAPTAPTTPTPSTASTYDHDQVDSVGQMYIITNGHTPDGEDLLKIEKIEMTERSDECKRMAMDSVDDAGSEASSITTTTTTTLSIDEIDKATSTQFAQTPQIEHDAIASATTNATGTQMENTNKTGTHITGLDTTDDEEDCRPQRVRRCSSLKTGKTPPGTPGRKKIVRFADVLGLDLADVKTFLDEIPTIPKSAFEDLEFIEQEPPIQLGPKSDKLLMPLFQQPGGLPTFLDIVREKQVSLENAAVTDHINQTITGSVRVRNLDFHKSVHIRYTMDGWRSFADLQANYVENSCDGFSDKFSFILFGNSLHIGQRLEFAVRFQCKGQQFWDNNYGANYCFQCLPTSSPVTTPIQPIVTTDHHVSHQMVGMFSPTAGDAWCSSFY